MQTISSLHKEKLHSSVAVQLHWVNGRDGTSSRSFGLPLSLS